MENKKTLNQVCKEFIDSKTTMTHCLIYEWAKEYGFYPKDIFIRVATGGRIWNPNLKQKHSRKYHSYWWVFEKKKELAETVAIQQAPRDTEIEETRSRKCWMDK